MVAKREERSELVAAAQSLENELQRFQSMAESLGKQRLDSGSSIERARRLLTEAAEYEGRISENVAALSGAIQALNERQDQTVRKIQQCVEVIQGRSRAYRELMTQYEDLGRAAQDLNERIRPMLGGANEPANIAGAMIEIETGGDELATKAQSLVAQATELEFTDVIRLSDALRQQLLAALNKLKLLGSKLARA